MAQGLLNTFKQSDPSDLPAVISKISWKSDPASRSNIAAANMFTCDHILKTGLGPWAFCLCQQWAPADTEETGKWHNCCCILGGKPSTAECTEAFLTWEGYCTRCPFVLLEWVTGGKFFRWSRHQPQRLPVRRNPVNAKLLRAYAATNTFPPPLASDCTVTSFALDTRTAWNFPCLQTYLFLSECWWAHFSYSL